MESTETVEVCSTITDHGVPEGWALCEIGMDCFGDFVEAIEKPARWPALQFEMSEIQRELQAFEAWELRLGKLDSIRCISFITQSIRSLGFLNLTSLPVTPVGWTIVMVMKEENLMLKGRCWWILFGEHTVGALV
ncbi:hypothetical protein Bca101_014761 [Brassica carinata]